MAALRRELRRSRRLARAGATQARRFRLLLRPEMVSSRRLCPAPPKTPRFSIAEVETARRGRFIVAHDPEARAQFYDKHTLLPVLSTRELWSWRRIELKQCE